jgi:hypothetical protein
MRAAIGARRLGIEFAYRLTPSCHPCRIVRCDELRELPNNNKVVLYSQVIQLHWARDREAASTLRKKRLPKANLLGWHLATGEAGMYFALNVIWPENMVPSLTAILATCLVTWSASLISP